VRITLAERPHGRLELVEQRGEQIDRMLLAGCLVSLERKFNGRVL